MKKLLFLLCLLPIYAYSASFDELEEAILEVNAEKVERILKDMGSLTDFQKMAYANVAQHKMEKLNMESYIKQIKGQPESELLVLGVCGFIISAMMTICYFTLGFYDFERDGIKPIGIAAAVLGIFYAMAEKGSTYEKKFIALKEKKLKDALYIQQKIYLS